MNKSLFANIFTTLHTGLFWRACSRLLPRKWNNWKTGTMQEVFLQRFRETLELKLDTKLISMYNARSALFHGMKHLGIQTGDEILLQAYTCISVPNAIIATGARPIYIDIDPQTANINAKLIEEAITKRTKAILIQHTFGIVADIDAIKSLCEKHDLLLIEDCAHALGASYNGKSVGTYGDMAIFSLGRDKILTSTNGGLLVLPHASKHEIDSITSSLVSPDKLTVFKNLLYIILGRLSYLLYSLKVGKVLYYIAAKCRLLPLILTPAEKTCSFREFHYMYPNCLADLGWYELGRIKEITHHRQVGVKRYADALGSPIVHTDAPGDVYLRVLYRDPNPKDRIAQAKKHNIHLGDPRYDRVIAGKGVDMSNAGYTIGSCPHAEELAAQTVNLPNHMLMDKDDYKSVIEIFKKVL